MATNIKLTVMSNHFLMTPSDAIKVLELLQHATVIDDAWDSDAERRGPDFKQSYWHYRDADVVARVESFSQPIEPKRRERLPAETTDN
jgi:hypothetical protein